MKKFRPLLLAICLASVLSISSLGSATVFADDGGPPLGCGPIRILYLVF